MAGRASNASDLLRTLASPHRLMIVCRLIEGDQSVGGLAADLDLQQTLVSQHLAILRRNRVVETKRVGQRVRYSLRSGVARAVAETLAAHFCEIPQDTVRAT
jgi:DNA-binding transcriptional ArsR family regulator